MTAPPLLQQGLIYGLFSGELLVSAYGVYSHITRIQRPHGLTTVSTEAKSSSSYYGCFVFYHQKPS